MVKNLDNMLVAKKVDLNKLPHIDIKGPKIMARKGFKFVQVRDSYTFILLPSDFRGTVVDFNLLQKRSSKRNWHLDTNTPLVQLQCIRNGSDCQHYRCARACVSCGGSCANQDWAVTTLPSDRLVIIPRFVRSGVDKKE